MTDKILNDLTYLQSHAFSFSLSVNPHAPFHQTMDEELEADSRDDWISEEEFHTAYATGKYIEGILYPLGSVSFYTLYGVDAGRIITAAASLLRDELSRTATEEHFDSRAFTPCAPPPKP